MYRSLSFQKHRFIPLPLQHLSPGNNTARLPTASLVVVLGGDPLGPESVLSHSKAHVACQARWRELFWAVWLEQLFSLQWRTQVGKNGEMRWLLCAHPPTVPHTSPLGSKRMPVVQSPSGGREVTVETCQQWGLWGSNAQWGFYSLNDGTPRGWCRAIVTIRNRHQHWTVPPRFFPFTERVLMIDFPISSLNLSFDITLGPDVYPFICHCEIF